MTEGPERERPERPRLHVFAGQIPLPLEGTQMVVDAVGGPDPHSCPDLPEGRWVPPIDDGLADVVEDHLLALRQTYHAAVRLLNTRYPVNNLWKACRFKIEGFRRAATSAGLEFPTRR